MQTTKPLSAYSDAELDLELKRRKSDRSPEAVNLRLGSPIGFWKVTTDGDCEGRSTLNLGTYEGHVADIAARLKSKCSYSLNFQRAEKLEEYPIKDGDVSIQLDVGTNTWGMSASKRMEVIYNWLKSVEPKDVDFTAKESNYAYAVKIVFQNKKSHTPNLYPIYTEFSTGSFD